MLRLEFLQKTLKTEVVGARCEAFTGIGTDSRAVTAGALFVALKGPTFNGHDFIAAALDHGAAGAIIERAHLERAKVMLGRKIQRFTLIPVADTLHAFGEIAMAWRASLKVVVAAVTGSNGKTTTKEMIAAVLGEVGAVVKTEGNFNNLIGLPITVLRMEPSHAYAVLEMGMNQPGEIKRLAEIARPDVALVTNAHPAHLEGLGTVEAIADEKCQIYEGLGSKGIAVVNADDPVVNARAMRTGHAKVTFGAGHGCDVRLRGVELMGIEGQRLNLEIRGGKVEAVIPHLGRHNALNATAAAAVATACGVDSGKITDGLANVHVVARRLEHDLIGGIHVLNDAYNANPRSMEGALETLVALKGGTRAFAVLGDMLELGPRSPELHAELGRAVAGMGVDAMIILGAESANTARGAAEAGMDPAACFKAIHAPDAAWILRKRARPGDWVLVKGSRGMRMEQVIEQFKASFSGG